MERFKIGELSTNSFFHKELSRKYLIYIPKSYEGKKEVPLLLNFHPFGTSAEYQLGISDFRQLSEDKEFILVYPEGAELASGEPHWNPLKKDPTNKSNSDDINFTSDLIDLISNNLNINSEKVYAVGYSNGADMAYGLATYLSSKISAIAAVSGSMYELMSTGDKPSHSTSVLNMTGTSDSIRPYEGIDGSLLAVDESLSYWKEINAIKSSPIIISETSNSEDVVISSYTTDNQIVTVANYKIINGGHNWFNLNISGKDTNNIIWDFFENTRTSLKYPISNNSKSYSGTFNEYTFVNQGNDEYGIKLDSSSTIDSLTGLSTVKFSDKTIDINKDVIGTFDQVTGLNTDSGEMFRLYNAAFARFPDADGLKYWIDEFSSGRNTRRVVAQSFLGSAEFTQKYGSDVSDETYVNNLYKNVLGRDADTEGLNYWVGNLSSGLETRYEALLGFAESAENKTLFSEMTGFV